MLLVSKGKMDPILVYKCGILEVFNRLGTDREQKSNGPAFVKLRHDRKSQSKRKNITSNKVTPQNHVFQPFK